MEDKKLIFVACLPECGFAVQSYDKKEIVKMFRIHARDVHNMDTTENEIKARIEEI